MSDGLLAPTPEEEAYEDSLWGRVGRGFNTLTSDRRRMAGLSGIAQGLLQAGAVSRRPISNAEAMAMASAGANQRLNQYDQNARRDLLAKEQAGPNIGTYNPRDYTEASFAKFLRTNNPDDLVRFAPKKTVMVSGVPYEFDQVNGKLVPLKEVSDVADDAATIAGTEKSAEIDVEQSKKVGLESFNQARTIRSSLSLYDEAIDALNNGANTGAVASIFPTIQAESKRLENIQNRLGLSVIQSTTFGALSENEMKLAMETAMPTGLNEPQLIKWLQDKKAAQTKAAEALENASAQLLSGEMSLADLAAIKADKNKEPAPSVGRFKIEVVE